MNEETFSIFDRQPRRENDPANKLDRELMIKRVIALRSEGKSTDQIATVLDMPARTVRNWLSEATAEIKADNRDFLAEKFAIHNHRCEWLYQRVMKELKERFSTDLIKTLLLILDRQARLLGLDKSGQARKDINAWIESATDEQLIAEAKKYNIPIPEKFDAEKAKG